MGKKKEKKYAEFLAAPSMLKKHVLNSNSTFTVVEAYKAARTNLLFTRVGEGCQKIVVTSSFEGEGKTVNCINLGITLSQNGLRVLIIDADMRRPVLQRFFELEIQYGLSETLAGMNGKASLTEDTTVVFQTKYDNLYVLPAGHTPPNPAELLASNQMVELLKLLEGCFDYILIDSPPVSIVTDAVVLSTLVHGYVFVVRAEQTPIEGLRTAVQRLEQVGGNIIGFILNGMDLKSSYKKYKGYGKYESGYDCSFEEQGASSLSEAKARQKPGNTEKK